MSKLGLRLVLAIGLGLSAATPLWADESAKSSPPDTTPYSRPCNSRRRRRAAARSGRRRSDDHQNGIDAVVNNTDANLKNTQLLNDGETSIAINPNNRNRIVISSFSGSWTTYNRAMRGNRSG